MRPVLHSLIQILYFQGFCILNHVVLKWIWNMNQQKQKRNFSKQVHPLAYQIKRKPVSPLKFCDHMYFVIPLFTLKYLWQLLIAVVAYNLLHHAFIYVKAKLRFWRCCCYKQTAKNVPMPTHAHIHAFAYKDEHSWLKTTFFIENKNTKHLNRPEILPQISSS